MAASEAGAGNFGPRAQGANGRVVVVRPLVGHVVYASALDRIARLHSEQVASHFLVQVCIALKRCCRDQRSGEKLLLLLLLLLLLQLLLLLLLLLLRRPPLLYTSTKYYFSITTTCYSSINLFLIWISFYLV